MTDAGLPKASWFTRVFRVWFAVLGGIGAWAVHEVFLASYARYSCNAKGSTWAMHAVTAATVAVTVLAMVLSLSLVRSNRGAHEEDNAAPSRLQFLGAAGLLIGAINLALILLEGSYVMVLRHCG